MMFAVLPAALRRVVTHCPMRGEVYFLKMQMITKTIKKYPKTKLTKEQIIALRCQAEKNGAEQANEEFHQKGLTLYRIYLKQKTGNITEQNTTLPYKRKIRWIHKIL
jgi:hypothetical protein